ncbi:hypothetical protein [Serratia marcescens]|uniref:hypothetical protein n=1 Tax=Serratia marcescens TaxID=615 RepID=UPI003D6E6E8C
MKELSTASLNHVSGGSVHWHQTPDGKISGGNDSLKSLPPDAFEHRTNSTTNRAIATAAGAFLGSAFGPAGSAAGAAIGQTVGMINK